MANYSRWDDIKKQRPGPTDEERVGHRAGLRAR